MKKIMLTMMAGCLLILNSCTKQGPVGPSGNANVIGENPFTVTAGEWTLSNNVYTVNITDNNITADVMNYGLIEIYKQYADGSWTNLPDINGDVSTVYNVYQGYFIISVLTTDNATTPAPGAVSFRVVVVPSSVRKAHPNTNWKNYNEAISAISASSGASL